MYKIYNKFLKRQWMVLNENNYNDFLDFFKQNKVIIVKPIDGEGGKGIEKYEYIEAQYRRLLQSDPEQAEMINSLLLAGNSEKEQENTII